MTDYNYIVKLGSTNTTIVKAGDGVLLLEPSVVALKGNKVLAVGSKALDMSGTGDIELVCPVADGVIKNKQLAIHMLREFLKMIEFKTLFTKNNVIMFAPSSITSQEKNDYVNVAYACMFTSVALLPTVFAGMVNMEIEEYDKRNHMLCALGGGVTDVAIVSSGAIVNACTMDLGGKTLDNAIKQYLFDCYHLEVKDDMLLEIKHELATLLPNDVRQYSFYAQNVETGNYGNVTITSTELRPMLLDYFGRVANIITGLMGTCESQVVADIGRLGIYLFGGVSCITGVDRYLSNILGMPVYVDTEPDNTVIYGATTLLNTPKLLESLLSKFVGE